jgi:cyclopropane fatty-acyl-phospholipid synthase-like methyltransferase
MGWRKLNTADKHLPSDKHPLKQKPEKLTAGWIFKNLATRIVSPRHWSRLYKVSKKGKTERVSADVQLKLYSDLLPGGFIHFGYFEDPDTAPESISFKSLEGAQRQHAEQVLPWLGEVGGTVLDVGCGTGGLSRLMHERGHRVVAMTPDKYQKEFLVQNLPEAIEIVHSRFEDLDLAAHSHRYQTIVNSESLQYLDKHRVLDILDKVLVPGGRWVICDYLRTAPGHPWSFSWGELEAAIQGRFTVLERRDITPHILPTLKYVHMFGARIANPAVNFFVEKVKTKEPGVAYLLGDVLDRVQEVLTYNVQSTDPSQFLREKSYRLLVLQKEPRSHKI